IRRDSRRSIHSSTTKSFTSHAKRVSILRGSERVMGPAPLLPASTFCQFFSVPVPSAVINPVPVMTTRRSATAVSSFGPWVTPPSRRLLLVGVDVVDGVSHGLDVLRFLVGDLDLELLLHRHHQLDDVQAVGAEV